MALIDEVAVKLGLKTADFKAALKSAGADLEGFKKAGAVGDNEGLLGSVKKMTARIGQFRGLLLGGGIVTAFRGLFEAAVTYAENYTGALDDSVAATLRLKDSSTGLEATIGKAFSGVVKFAEDLGMAAGATVFGIEAAADALIKMDAAAQKAFSAKLVKDVTAATDALSKARLEGALSAADLNGKVNVLAAEQVRLLLAQSKVRGNIVEFLKLQVEIEKNATEIGKVEADIKKEQTKGSEERVKLEQELRDVKLQLISDEDQVLVMEDELAGLQATALAGAMEINDSLQLRLRIAKLELALAEKRDAVQKAHTEETKRTQAAADKVASAWDKVAKTMNAALGSQKELKDADKSRSQKSLADIAAGGGGTTQSDRARAREILRLEREATTARARGFGDSADQRMQRADALRVKLAPVLKSSEVDPLQTQRDKAFTDSRDYLASIKDYLKPVEVEE